MVRGWNQMIKGKSGSMHESVHHQDQRKREKCDVRIEPEARSATQRSWRGSGSDAETVANTKARVTACRKPVSFIIWWSWESKEQKPTRGQKERQEKYAEIVCCMSWKELGSD